MTMTASRRAVVAGVASLPAIAALPAMAVAGTIPADPDPIFAAIGLAGRPATSGTRRPEGLTITKVTTEPLLVALPTMTRALRSRSKATLPATRIGMPSKPCS